MTRAAPKMLKHSIHVWALSNRGNVWGAYGTRRQAIYEAEFAHDEPWAKIKAHIEVRKVTLIEGWK